MPDPKTSSKTRKIRVQTTGGRADLDDISAKLGEFAKDRGFDVRVFNSERFGDHGPLWKDQYELISTDALD